MATITYVAINDKWKRRGKLRPSRARPSFAAFSKDLSGHSRRPEVRQSSERHRRTKAVNGHDNVAINDKWKQLKKQGSEDVVFLRFLGYMRDSKK